VGVTCRFIRAGDRIRTGDPDQGKRALFPGQRPFSLSCGHIGAHQESRVMWTKCGQSERLQVSVWKPISGGGFTRVPQGGAARV
jgi:hypothetical protein